MIDINKLKEEQIKLAQKVVISDSVKKIKTIAGAEQAFIENKVISAIVVCSYDTLETIEKIYAVAEAKMQYISGYMFYREGPALIEAFNKLENKPDILIVNGNGILHPRRIRMASHAGILLDMPTIGIAKSLMIGEKKGDTIYVDKEARGYELTTREHANPIYVSPGHKVSLKTSFEIIKHSIKLPHKLPEPLHLAHAYANKIRKDMTEKKN